MDDDFDYVSRCVVCGDVIDYCLGHGIDDRHAAEVWTAHDYEDHRLCHPDAGCNNNEED